MKLTKSQLINLIKEELSTANDEQEVLVPGYGRLRVDQIKRRLQRDLSEMAEHAAKGNFRAIGSNRLELLRLFLKTLDRHDALGD
tara:strand:- start:89 stop:343 length:255 start_codon:yes stop_codon:yes gene_type:complete